MKLLTATSADLEPAPEPVKPKPTPAYVVAAFAPLPRMRAGQDLTREHAVCLDAYRHACGLPTWLELPGADVTVAVNQAVNWWNSFHGKKRRRNDA